MKELPQLTIKNADQTLGTHVRVPQLVVYLPLAQAMLNRFSLQLSKGLLCFGMGVCLSISSLCWSAGGQVTQKTDAELQQEVEAMISLRHPPREAGSGAWWHSLGPHAAGVIRQMLSQNRPISEKIRLIEALSYFNDGESAEFLKKLYREGKSQVVQDAAVKALAASQGGKEAKFLESALGKSSSHLKIRVAQVMDDRGDRASVQFVERLMKKEKANSQILAKIRRHRTELEERKLKVESKENIPLQKRPFSIIKKQPNKEASGN